MKIAFATTQSLTGSTVAGRILPLARELTGLGHEIHILVLDEANSEIDGITLHCVGHLPWQRAESGKKRLRGLALIFNMKMTALRTAIALWRLKPDATVIVKTLPANVAGVWLWSKVSGGRRVVLDVDDFELSANQLTSLPQRAAVHWAERAAVKVAGKVVTASPFLSDHFKQLGAKTIEMIPTGLNWQPGLQTPASNTVAYVGSISVSSGHRVDMLPEIFKEVVKGKPEARLLMIGDGDDTKNIKEKFEAAGLAGKVEWLGRFNNETLPKVLEKVTVIVDPIDASITQRAKSSFRVMLAAAAGLPVVTANVGVRPQLLPASLREKFFAQPGKAVSFAAKVIERLDQPLSEAERHELQNHAQQFSWQKLAQKYDTVFRA